MTRLMGSWEFPLSDKEKVRHVMVLFKYEVDSWERTTAALGQENMILRSMVKSLRQEVSKLQKRVDVGARPAPTAQGQKNTRRRRSMMQSFGEEFAPIQEVVSFVEQATTKMADETSEAFAALGEQSMEIHSKARASAHAIYSNCDENLKKLAQANALFAEDTVQELWNKSTRPVQELWHDNSASSSAMQMSPDALVGKAAEAAESITTNLWTWGLGLVGSSDLEGQREFNRGPQQFEEEKTTVPVATNKIPRVMETVGYGDRSAPSTDPVFNLIEFE